MRDLVPRLWRGHLYLACIVGAAWTLYAPFGAFVLTFVLCTYLDDIVVQIRYPSTHRPRARR